MMPRAYSVTRPGRPEGRQQAGAAEQPRPADPAAVQLGDDLLRGSPPEHAVGPRPGLRGFGFAERQAPRARVEGPLDLGLEVPGRVGVTAGEAKDAVLFRDPVDLEGQLVRTLPVPPLVLPPELA